MSSASESGSVAMNPDTQQGVPRMDVATSTPPATNGLRANVQENQAWRFPDDLMVQPETSISYQEFLPEVPQPFALQGEVEGAKRAIFTDAFLAADSSVGLLVGPQACGKSAVAAALARDPQVQSLYPGGVLWVHCGEAATPWWVLRQVWALVQRVRLGTTKYAVPWLVNIGHKESTLSQELVQMLACQKTLLVLDDVRDARVARACNPLGSHLLCTTFQASLSKRLQTAVSSAGVRVYEMRVLTRSNMQILLCSHFPFQGVDPPLMEALHAMIGRLPLELVLISFLFQVVKSYVAFDNKTLMAAVMKRLLASHRTLQEQLHNEAGAQHLSQSHLFCWRTLAVTLELFPSMYRRCMFQLALAPPGTLMSAALLQELWDLSPAEISSAIQMFTSVCMLVHLPTPDGPRWHVSNLAQDYMVYWARMTGKGSEIGRLQRWLLADIGRAARICNPFSACGHNYLLRSRSATAEAVRLTSSANNVNIDPVLTETIKKLVAMPPDAGLDPEIRAGFAASLAAAALDLRLHELALELIKHALEVYQLCLPSTRFALVRCQLVYSAVHALMALGQPGDAMREVENVLKETQDSSLFAPFVQHQLVTTLLEGAYNSNDPDLALSLATVRSQMAHELYGPGVQHAAALGELVKAQLFKCEKPSAIKQTIKLARQTLERCTRHFTLLHLNLERAVIAYYLFIGRIADVETKMCKLYLQIQQVYDPHHEIAALLMNDIALCLNIQGNFSDALDMLLEALALFERPGATVLTQQACALAHNNLAVSLAALGRPREAQKHLRVALKGIKSMHCPFVHAQPTLYLQAALLIHLQEFDAAREHLLKTVFHYSAPRHRRVSAAAAALETLGVLFIAQADASSAEHCLDQSLAVSAIVMQERGMRQLNDVEVAKCYYLLSMVCDHLGKGDKAKECLEKFKKIHAAHKSHPFLSWAANLNNTSAAFAKCMVGDMASGDLDNTKESSASCGSFSNDGGGSSDSLRMQRVSNVIHSDPELEAMELL